MKAEEWIIQEDNGAQADRIFRLQWLIDNRPQTNIWLFHDGFLSKELFEQTRYCYVYGQYLGTIILGLSFMEHTLGALLFSSGRDDLKRGNLSVLVDESHEVGWIDDKEKDAIEQSSKLRNDITHYRNPSDKNHLIKEIGMDLENPELFYEEKARQVLEIVIKLLNHFSVR